MLLEVLNYLPSVLGYILVPLPPSNVLTAVSALDADIRRVNLSCILLNPSATCGCCTTTYTKEPAVEESRNKRKQQKGKTSELLLICLFSEAEEEQNWFTHNDESCVIG